MSFSMTKLSAALLLTSSLVGCAAMVKTPYQAPSVQVPGSFQYDNPTKAKTVSVAQYSDRWWTLFNDAQLNQLVNNVLERNSDLAVAGITLKQARLKADLSCKSTRLAYQFKSFYRS